MRVSKHVAVDATFIELLPSLYRNESVEVCLQTYSVIELLHTKLCLKTFFVVIPIEGLKSGITLLVSFGMILILRYRICE